jgi:hypothetical protein
VERHISAEGVFVWQIAMLVGADMALTVLSASDIFWPLGPFAIAVCSGCSWNGRPSRYEQVSPLEVGLTTLRLPSYDLSRAGLLTNHLKAQSRGSMPLR